MFWTFEVSFGNFFKKQENYIHLIFKQTNVKPVMGSRETESGKVDHKIAFHLKYFSEVFGQNERYV